MNIVDYFNSPVCIRFALALVHFLWQGLAIAVLGIIMANLFGKNSSRIRYGVYVTSLLAMVLSLGVTYALVDVSIPQFEEKYQADTIPIYLEPSVTLPEADLPETTQPSNVSLAELSSDTKAVEVPEPTASPKFHFSLDWQRYTPYLISLYILGVVVMLSRLLLGLQGGQRLRKFSEPVEDAAILASLRQQARTLGLTFIPAIAFCKRVIVPTVVGVIKPTILLPISFASSLSPQQVEMLLAHELAHIRRYDPLVNIVQRIIEAVLFFHPAVWFISRRIRIERENCCDDMVLEMGGKATEYASSLVDIAQRTLLATASKQRFATEGVSAAGQPSRLGNRIRRLMGAPKSQQIRLKHTWVIASLLILALALPIAIAMSSRPNRDKQITDFEKNAWGEEVNGLRCSIEMEPRELRVGDPTIVQVKITNATDKAIDFYYQDLYGAENLMIVNERGEVIPSIKTAVYNWPHPKEFFRLIKPGETFAHQIKGRVKFKFLKAEELLGKKTDRPLLVDFKDVSCNITETGDFTAVLGLSSDEKTTAWGKNNGFNNIWTGELQSNQIGFSVRLMRREELDKAITAISSGSDEEKSEAIEILAANADQKATKKLMEILGIGSGLHLSAAADALVRIQDTSIIPDLITLYNQSIRYDETVGEFKQIVLRTIKGLEHDKQKVNDLLLDVLKSDAPVEARSYAVWELARVNYKLALPAMIQLARTHEPRMQWASIDALGSFGTRLDDDNKNKLLKHLLEIMKNDPDETVRSRAVSALAMIGGTSVSGELIKALKDPNPWVGNTAVIYLGRYGGPEAISPLKEYLSLAEKEQFKRVTEEAIKLIRQRTNSDVQVAENAHLRNVKFKVVDEATGEPIRSRELNICYFVNFRLKPGAPSPYLNKNEDFYITSKTTDDNGVFTLDLSSIQIADIVVEPGKPYNIVRFERSSDLAHTKSSDHIRVVGFKAETTGVVNNMIYDLKRKIVKAIPISGGPQETSYEEILLVAKKRKESRTKSTVQVEGEENVSEISSPLWLKARTLNFPADRSIGMLKTRKWDSKSHGVPPHEYLAEARGEVHVPAGQMLGLEIARGKPVDLSPLADLNPNDLQSLFLYRTEVQDADLRHISHLVGLEQIGLGITKISDEGLKYLSGLKNLKELNLSRTNITDVGVVHLRGLGKLKILLLEDTSITDVSVDHLKELTSLTFLRIKNTKITPQGITFLKQALPECSIDHDIVTKHESDWGETVNGLKCRLGATKNVWRSGKAPAFAIEVYNVTDETIVCAANATICKMEVDGQWYEWAGNKYAEVLSFLLKPGKENSQSIEIRLISRVWASKTTGRQLELKPGKHVIRALYRPNPDINEVSLVSRSLEIETLPATESTGQVGGEKSKKGHLQEVMDVPVLIDVLDDEDLKVRATARNNLRNIGSPAIGALVEALKNEKLDVRMGAAMTLGMMGPKAKDATGALINAIKGDDKFLRSYASGSLMRIDEPPFSIIIELMKDKEPFVRRAIVENLGDIGPEAVALLIQALKDKDSLVRNYACWGLGNLGPEAKNAIDPLTLATQDDDKGVRYQAVEALKKIKPTGNNSLYQKQDSIEDALDFIGTPEDMMDSTGFVKKGGQLAGPEQLVLVNKLFKANFDKDVNMFSSVLSEGTKKEVNNNWNMAYILSSNIKDGTFLPTDDENVIKFFAVSREFTDKDHDSLKDNVSWPEMPTHVIAVFHFSRPSYMLTGSSLYVAKDEVGYKLVCPTSLKEPVELPTRKKKATGPKNYGIVEFTQNDEAYTQSGSWKYKWKIELERNVSENNTFQLLKTTKVISGQAELHPEIAVQKLIDESVIEKYKYKGLKCRIRVGNREPSYNYHNYGQKLSGWSWGFSMASMGESASIFFPGKDVTNIKTNKQGNFVGSDLELLSFETSEENVKYEHKVILRKNDSPEAKSAALMRLKQMKQRQISDKKLYYLRKILRTYANDHNSTYPDRLEQVKPYDIDEWLNWLLENIEYLGKGIILTETSQTLLAYDKTLLGKTGSTTVLFNEGPVQYYKPNRLKKLGITSDRKNGVEVEGENRYETAQKTVFPESVLINALERGNSLVIARILSVRANKETKPGEFYFYKTKIIEPIIIGDLRESDIREPVELFAGSSFGDALTPGSTYALFIAKGAPYHLSWGFRNDIIKLDGFNDENLQALVETTTEIYRKTSIRKFRESKFQEASSLSKLPEKILPICEQFRANPQSRAGFAKKIYESDMGSRRDISGLGSSQITYLPPKIMLYREQILSLFGRPTLKSGWTYKWFCGEDNSDSDGEKYVGVLSVIFDKNEKTTHVLYNAYDKTNWVKTALPGSQISI